MADAMHPLPIEDLSRWIFAELEQRRSVFGLPAELFFEPRPDQPFATQQYGQVLETPLGVAAGPQTQMAQNILVAYLAGARFIELKTVQTLDELEVTKPCIDMQDVGYNCEWSQELRLEQSFSEYLKAWVLIHALRAHLGHRRGDGQRGFVFNMSLGYNLEGIHEDNVQRFLARMAKAAEQRDAMLERIADRVPADLEVGEQLSDNVTLSTMHGCPPEEIERIGLYLIEQLGLHTAIKLNPTLLGPDALREILHGELGHDDIEVPDEAFEHDPGYADAVSMIRSLRDAAAKKGVCFGLKLTNTLETRNLRKALPEKEPVHYMSGRALHPLSVQLAQRLFDDFEGQLAISLAGGVDAFNLPPLIAAGLSPVTVCSDLLRPGGYGRLAQYVEELSAAMRAAKADDAEELACRRAVRGKDGADRAFELLAGQGGLSAAEQESFRAVFEAAGDVPVRERVRAAARRLDRDAAELQQSFVRACRRVNLRQHAKALRGDVRYAKPRRRVPTKTDRPLGRFDCIGAPCTEGCPAQQNVPDYMYLVARGRYDEAMDVVLRANPLPSITGSVCDHPCMSKCVRGLYDRPLAIREIKRFISERCSRRRSPARRRELEASVGVIGAGPAGLAAAYFLALEGFRVTLYDARDEPGGVPAQMIPAYRLPESALAEDIELIRNLGVELRFGVRVGEALPFEEIREQHRYVFVGIGASLGISLGIEGEDAQGVFDCLDLLTRARAGCAPPLGRKALVIGGGNSAMDAARTARRLVGPEGNVIVVYRRTISQMPADDEEIAALRTEGIAIRELCAPARVLADGAGRVRGLACLRMKLGEVDASGRPRPVPVDEAEEEIEADAIVVAVGQQAEVDFLERAGVRIGKRKIVEVDERTGETSIASVFAGGDAVRGGATVIQAEADARRAVAEILRREGLPEPAEPPLRKEGSPRDYLLAKSRRDYGEPLPELPAGERTGFDRVVLSLREDQARREASRCLSCDEYCSLCTTVCPNRANLEIACEPFETQLELLAIRGKKVERTGERRAFRVEQPTQVVNLADLCNECGNCQTFCPTAGAPYRDKIRLCFSDESFEREQAGWRVRKTEIGFHVEAKLPDGLHSLESDGQVLAYRSPRLRARLAESDLAVKQLEPGELARDGETCDLETCAAMLVLGRALIASAGFLPGMS
ncbi:MAG: FAD-dependent oxidoreductase [Deltaproteobacteria bacterium]|nr:FAD-dependent oxidoreductase [Deltaproteobacteria bacterium]